EARGARACRERGRGPRPSPVSAGGAMRARVALGTLLLLGALPTASMAQSLFRDNGPGASLFVDRRARSVNDILTILIVEQSSSSRSATTDVAKDSSLKAGVNQFPSIFDGIAKKVTKPLTEPFFGPKAPSNIVKDGLSADISGKFEHNGKGAID